MNSAVGKQCDNFGGADSSACNGNAAGTASCRLSVCGDGHKNAAAGEACDNGVQTRSRAMATAQVSPAASSLPAVTVIPTRWQERHVMSAVQIQRYAMAAVQTLLLCAVGLRPAAMAMSITQLGKNVTPQPAKIQTYVMAYPLVRFNCHLVRCGDGYVNTKAGEQCERTLIVPPGCATHVRVG